MNVYVQNKIHKNKFNKDNKTNNLEIINNNAFINKTK